MNLNDAKSKLSRFAGNKQFLVILLVVIIFIIAALFIYRRYISSGLNKKYVANNEFTNEGPVESADIYFFYTTWCPHCKTAKPIWDDLKSEYENKTINGYKVIFTEINCTEETAEVEQMMNKYNIEGFPTIKLLKDGQVVEYDAKPSKDTLNQFLNTVL